jgi:K+-transporting ATPase KdpF subunit
MPSGSGDEGRSRVYVSGRVGRSGRLDPNGDVMAIAAGVVALLLLCYLVVALVKPERF